MKGQSDTSQVTYIRIPFQIFKKEDIFTGYPKILCVVYSTVVHSYIVIATVCVHRPLCKSKVLYKNIIKALPLYKYVTSMDTNLPKSALLIKAFCVKFGGT